jgi:hypothetical protein
MRVVSTFLLLNALVSRVRARGSTVPRSRLKFAWDRDCLDPVAAQPQSRLCTVVSTRLTAVRVHCDCASSICQMSLIDDATEDAADCAAIQAFNGLAGNSNLRFVPRELALKCHTLVESYHAMYGYGCLPDMLWQSDARCFVECHPDLAKIFKDASNSRCAKRAYKSLLTIATIVVALEALARDFAGWGKRFPAASLEAEELLGNCALKRRTWFMDMYLFPSGVRRKAASTRAPRWAAADAAARNLGRSSGAKSPNGEDAN